MHIISLFGYEPSYWTQTVRAPWAAVTVRAEGGTRKTGKLIIEEGIHVLRPDAQIAPLPEGLKVFDPDGEEVLSERGGFYITTESFDPYHLLCDGLPPWGGS